MKITITKIARFTTKKDGTALMTKTGKPYTSVRLQCQEYGDKWVSGFGNQANSGWKEGDTVEVDVEQKGEYLNFSIPKPEEKIAETLAWIQNKMVKMNLDLETIKEHVVPAKKPHVVDYPTAESEGIDTSKTFPDDDELNNFLNDQPDER